MKIVLKFSKYLRNFFSNHIDIANYLFVYVIRIKYFVVKYDRFNLDSLKKFIIISDASYTDTENKRSLYKYYLQLYEKVIHYKTLI